jgi:hypothetical protein
MPVSTLWVESYTGKAAIFQGCLFVHYTSKQPRNIDGKYRSRKHHGHVAHVCDAFYFLDQYSSPLKRVVYSSFGAEILACAEADDRLFALRSSFQELLSRTFESELLVDSKGLYSCISTLSNNKEYRLRRTVAIIRESFDSGDLDVLRWIRGDLNLTDGQTSPSAAAPIAATRTPRRRAPLTSVCAKQPPRSKPLQRSRARAVKPTPTPSSARNRRAPPTLRTSSSSTATLAR